MRISIWQQFSSNHSNSFIVVGKFKTEQEAYSAYLHVRRVMRRIIEAHQIESPEINPIPGYEDRYAPSPIEIEVFAPYGIVPRHLSDWTTYLMMREDWLHDAVQFYENYIYVCDPVTGYAGAEPWDRFVASLGGEIQKSEETEPEHLVVDFICSAPDVEVAQRIYQQLNLDFEVQPLPWLLYAYHRADEIEALKALEEQYLIWQVWDKERQRLEHLFNETPRRDRDTVREMIAQHAREQPFETDNEIHGYPPDSRSLLQFSSYFATISMVNERQIYCRNLVFDPAGYGRSVPAIVSWMRDQGCEVSYVFRRTRFRRETTINCRTSGEITANKMAEKLRSVQTDQPETSEDHENDILLTSRDKFSISFDQITVVLYSGNGYRLRDFLYQNGCRSIKMIEKYIEIVGDEP